MKVFFWVVGFGVILNVLCTVALISIMHVSFLQKYNEGIDKSRELVQQEVWAKPKMYYIWRGINVMRTAQEQNNLLYKSDVLILEVSKQKKMKDSLWGLLHSVCLPALRVNVSECMTVLHVGCCPVTFGRHVTVTRAFSRKPARGGVISENDS